MGTGGVSHQELYLDGMDGRVLDDREPWKGMTADILVQAQSPLYSGRLLGLPGHILILILDLVFAMLAITGVLIWLCKRRARKVFWSERTAAARASVRVSVAGGFRMRP